MFAVGDFDGSSIRGFSRQQESDLRLAIDWPAFYWLPSDVFGPGKVLAFGEVRERDGSPYSADMRALLKGYTDTLYTRDGMVAHAANEIEGFLFRGRDAERAYHETSRFELISTGGYYHSLPGDALRQFIDTAAEVQRAMGFANEKDHRRGKARKASFFQAFQGTERRGGQQPRRVRPGSSSAGDTSPTRRRHVGEKRAGE